MPLIVRLRQIRRLLGLVATFAFAGIDYLMTRGWSFTPQARAAWLSRWARFLLRRLGFELAVSGPIPSGSFLTPNHLGYMDIVVLAAVAPQVFLSKSEVGKWPVVGMYTRMAGTLFIDRKRRSGVTNWDQEFGRVIQSGLCMTVFLEGTSTDGQSVLPFRSSLLASVVANGWPVTPVYLNFECVEGDPATDICWWGDMTFGGHLPRMAKVKSTRATIVFGETRVPGPDRKLLAQELYQSVLALRESTENRDRGQLSAR